MKSNRSTRITPARSDIKPAHRLLPLYDIQIKRSRGQYRWSIYERRTKKMVATNGEALRNLKDLTIGLDRLLAAIAARRVSIFTTWE